MRTLKEDRDEIAITEQLMWIERCGGDLQGYRRKYAAAMREISFEHRQDYLEDIDCDAIYYADINHLRKLQGHPQFLIEHDEAVRVLGEGYFA